MTSAQGPLRYAAVTLSQAAVSRRSKTLALAAGAVRGLAEAHERLTASHRTPPPYDELSLEAAETGAEAALAEADRIRCKATGETRYCATCPARDLCRR